MKRVPELILLEKIAGKLTDCDVAREHAEILARVLVYADAAGISSHGTIRLPHYLQRLQQGGINLSSAYAIVPAKYPWAASLDAAGGWGHVATEKAVAKGIELAGQFGFASINIHNSSHCGALSYYLRSITAQGYLSMIVANTDAIVVPTGGTKPFFGTNPLGFGFPTSNEDNPVIIDMGTSAGALGKIFAAKEQGQSIPTDWAVDSEGMPTDNPDQVVSLLPMAGHKGYSLAFLVETFAAILIGGAFGPHITPMYTNFEKRRNLSLHMLIMKPDIYLTEGEFEENISEMINELHSAEVAAGAKKIMVPGEPEWLCLQESQQNGPPVLESICDFLGV